MNRRRPIRQAGRTALITGAAKRLGRACALALAAAGADVAVNYRTQEQGAKETCAQVERLGRRALSVKADVSTASEVARMVQTVGRELGPVDILVNNAGIARRQSWDQVSDTDWDEMIMTNLKSVFLVTQAILPGMKARSWGRIINLSSGAARTGGLVGPHYAASKGGILGLTHYYASVLIKEGITVNALAPSLIGTDMMVRDLRVDPKISPLGRFGTAEEVADVLVMLATNAYITGQTIFINGGRYMT